jgi:23S rRNA (uracil747-C5)-methyltransferase
MSSDLSVDQPQPLQCRYFDAHSCRSCSLLETPYAKQLRDKAERCRVLLPQVPASQWLPVVSADDRGFRNRAKLVVGGEPGQVTLGILGPDGRGIDLRECAIHAPEIAAIIPTLAEFLESTGLAPYDVRARRGEVKFVHVTLAPSLEIMVRFVVRSEIARDLLRSRLKDLRTTVPHAAVISVNLLPEHKAVLEGDEEELLWGDSLAMHVGTDRQPLTLHLQPQSFFQTNTAVARALYAQVAAWAVAASPASLWDLYCGVGGFALHCASALKAARDDPDDRTVCDVVGVELSEAAVSSARRSAREAALQAQFTAVDATEYATRSSVADRPDLLIVNPPRRGLGEPLATWIEDSRISTVAYSSCNPESLARDLAMMPSYEPREARVFDMFPHTAHLEVAVLLQRTAS